MTKTNHFLPAFSLVELLVVVSISSILLGFGFSAYRHTQERQLLYNATKEIQTILRTIQKKAEVGDKDCQGVFKYYQVIITPNTNKITTQAICQNTQGPIQTHSINNITFTNGGTLHFQPLQEGLVITSPQTTNLNLTFQLDINTQITTAINIAQPGTIN